MARGVKLVGIRTVHQLWQTGAVVLIFVDWGVGKRHAAYFFIAFALFYVDLVRKVNRRRGHMNGNLDRVFLC